MNRPWMPLYPADYLGDTGHLTTAEHGAYLLLIMHYWMNGGLPSDERQIGRITRMSERDWKKSKPIVQALFVDGWVHKRVELEMTEAARISRAGQTGGQASAKARAERQRSLQNRSNDPPTNGATNDERSSNDCTNDPPTNGQPLPLQSQPPTRKQDAASAALDLQNGHGTAPDADLFRRGKEVCGKQAGGLIRNLLKAKGGNIPLARAAVETAATKQNPREWIAKVVQGDERSNLDYDPAL